ncbi:MAG: ATP-binding protein [Spirochaetales bacterium]|nr:ATP-binding protein [Spirochaetales bacterium]
MISRKTDLLEVKKRISAYKITAILGPRQSGKTTLAREFEAADYFDLENPGDLARLDNPQLALEHLEGLIVIDEIQRKPDLFPLLRYLVDKNPGQRYLILGSASRSLIRQSSESLAGRISYYYLFGLRTGDISEEKIRQLWLRGGLPPSYLAESDASSYQWREDYITTFLERDIPALGIRIPAYTIRRFWQMLSFYHGNIINLSEIGRSFGIADTTVRHYLDILQGTFMIRLLYPCYTNTKKRLVKRPKLYFRDSGIFHSLMTIESYKSLQSNPRLGASWEGFAFDAVWRSINKPDDRAYFWATHSGAELDLFWQHDGHNWGCEFKYADAPKLTRSMSAALDDVNFERLWVIYPGNKAYRLHEKIIVLPLSEISAPWKY